MATATWTAGTVWGGVGDNTTWTGGLGASGAPAAGDSVILSLAGPNTLTLGASTPVLNSLTMSNSDDVLALVGGFALNFGAGGVSLAAGTLSLQSGALAGTGTLSVSSGAVLSGYGNIFASSTSVAASATILASGGTLDFAGAVAAPAATMTVGAKSTDKLMLEKADTLGAVAFASATGLGTLEIYTAGALTLTNALAIGANSVKLDAAAGAVQLTDAGGITLANGMLFGTGGIATGTTISGYGSVQITLTANASGQGAVTASGGKLYLTGPVIGGTYNRTLAIDSSKASDLEIAAAATSTAISITNANQTLEIAGAVTLTTAQSVYGGTLKMSGGTLTDSSGITLGHGATSGSLIGGGTVNASIGPDASSTVASGITATGGVLTINGAISAGAAPLNLTIGAGASDALTLNTTSSVTGLTFLGSTGMLNIASAAALTLTAAAAIGANGVTLANSLQAVQLTDAGGLTLAGGLISGGGTIASATALSGYGTVQLNLAAGTGAITASGGTLTLTGLVNYGASSGLRPLAIGTLAGSDLYVGATSTANATSIAIGNANQTLDVAGTLTLTAAESLTNGTIRLDGGTLTDSSSMTLGAGSTLTGYGIVSGAIAGLGLINANVAGAGLTVSNALTGTTALQIGAASGAAARLQLNGVDVATSLTFAGSGVLSVGTSGSLTLTNALDIGANTVSLANGGYVLTDLAKSVTIEGGTLNGSGVLDPLSSITGYGTIGAVASYALAGAGTITALGGATGTTLDISGAFSGRKLVIATTAASDLKLEGTLTTAAFTLNSANQTLEVGSAGSLTLTGAQSLTNATIKVDGGTLTDTSGLVIGAGATLSGSGLINYSTAISGSGTIASSGGTLRVGGTLSGSLAMSIGTGSTLQLINLGASTAQTSITFGAGYGTLDLTYELSGLNQFQSTVYGFTGVNGATATSDVIKVTSSTGTDHLVWTQNGGLGTLKVESATNVVQQTISMTGTYYQKAFVLTQASSVDQITYNSSVACYVAGSRIATARGEVAVEDLRIGDLVVTASGAERPIVWMGHREIEVGRHPDPAVVSPVVVRADAFGAGAPRRDLWLSPGHSVAREGALIPVSCLINGHSVAQVEVERVQYWHVELDAHDVILAEGLPAESYLDTGNRTAFSNGAAFAEGGSRARACLPLALHGPAVEATKARLLARLADNGLRVTHEADAHILVDGRRIDPIQLSERRLAFVLPRSGREIALCSLGFTPAHTVADSGDTRTLGLCVARLAIDGHSVPLGRDVALKPGWQAAEYQGAAFAHRWTTGAARLPSGVRIVIVDLAGRGCYWQDLRSAAQNAARLR